MIEKKVRLELTNEEIFSPDPIKITLEVGIVGEEGYIEYVIEYPKDLNIPKSLPSVEDVREFLSTDKECQKILKGE
jgi:hypothetical protein